MDLEQQDFQYMPALKAGCRVCLLLYLLYSSIGMASAEAPTSAVQSNARVVSLAPSITEIIFALGEGEQLVGVSDYCDYPLQVKNIPKVGGFIKPNLEIITTLKPTIVFGLEEHKNLSEILASFGIKFVANKQNSLEGIFFSIEAIGKNLGQAESAKMLVENMKAKISAIQKDSPPPTRPSVLVTVGGHAKRGSLDSVYGAGRNTLYHQLLELAGGKNVLDSSIKYSKLSSEALLTLDPEVIIDLVPAAEGSSPLEVKRLKTETLATWRTISKLQAVAKQRVHILTEEFVINPGPRTVQTLDLFASAIYREKRPHAAR